MCYDYHTIINISKDRYNEIVKEAEINRIIKNVSNSKPSFLNSIIFNLGEFWINMGKKLKQRYTPLVIPESFLKKTINKNKHKFEPKNLDFYHMHH